ncbi:DUF262 domain-containing HNH endonuclease family protein [Salinimicrobium sp. MT39]|uniref:DUF262 domain-containing HNH endonuclease family protein n=1 Tax=Salinimicrobium profundisediminis TaxID=2994553 RepID=A0A9X3CW35_9FLAO|nr:DUF262 domain-containing HNH endonuclease family protein [Salinimicrobium profundisediminis]MCX2837881.1 DUF262 domain-containing HNH endonuclease family protein [Salinimicrobium profundisediminis]
MNNPVTSPAFVESINTKASAQRAFEIKASSCTLKENSQEGGNIILGENKKYCIPIYQRTYSWTEIQLKKFISDLFSAFSSKVEQGEAEPIFIGTMQISAIKEGEHQIIDGQQRLTTFFLLLRFLKEKFPESSVLKEEKFDWLRTEVNNGEQQKFLKEVIESPSSVEGSLNPYKNNYNLIQHFFEEQMQSMEEELGFNIEDFLDFLFSKVYFVLIETRAGLSKNLQIFDAINTTGLDLNGGDVFKIRMYEYLHDIKKQEKSIFEDISALYEKIDKKNKEFGDQVTDIQQILAIYQYVIVARHQLPGTLYSLGANTFFERLFDSIFKIEKWENFSKASNVEISLKELDEIIDCRFLWHRNWKYKKNFSAEDAGAVKLIWNSRYGRFWHLYSVFLFQLKEDENRWEKLLYFTRQLNRLFFIYSVRFDKRINEIYSTLMHRVIDRLVNGSYEEVMSIINDKIGKETSHNTGWKNLNYSLTTNLVENAKRKNLICRLSAMLEENYKSTEQSQIKDIINRIFDEPLDVEHIEAYNHIEESKRVELHAEWGQDINSLGNLIILESNINRGIKNKPYIEKIKQYHTSKFPFIKNFHLTYPEWNLNTCKSRTEIEKNKILAYLFKENEKPYSASAVN